MEKIIEVRYQWQQGKFSDESELVLSAEDYCNIHLIELSRYSRYNYLRFLFINRFGKERLSTFLNQLSKYFSIYSIVFDKSIYHVQTKMFNLLKKMYESNTSSDDIINLINQYIKEPMQYEKGDSRQAVSNVLNFQNIVYNAKKKNIICRTSAMLDEDGIKTTNGEQITKFRDILFRNQIDIEHIQSVNHKDIILRNQIQNEWGNNLNSIGNLVVLEYSINRKIGNNEVKKIDGYKQSQFKSVNKLANDVNTWTIEKCINRKKDESEKLLNYWFG
ncbi:MAG: DUF1524 domain-containing protein [Mariniphaga sp.]